MEAINQEQIQKIRWLAVCWTCIRFSPRFLPYKTKQKLVDLKVCSPRAPVSSAGMVHRKQRKSGRRMQPECLHLIMLKQYDGSTCKIVHFPQSKTCLWSCHVDECQANDTGEHQLVVEHDRDGMCRHFEHQGNSVYLILQSNGEEPRHRWRGPCTLTRGEKGWRSTKFVHRTA